MGGRENAGEASGGAWADVFLLAAHRFWFYPLPAVIAIAAWTSIAWLWLLIFLPALFMSARTRTHTLALAFSYYAAFARDVPEIYTRFFPDAWPGWGWIAWAVHAALLALPWAILSTWASDRKRAALSGALALTIMCLPPIGLLHWGSPLLAAGLLYPGTGLLGLFATCMLIGVMPPWQSGERTEPMALFVFFVIGALAANLFWRERDPPSGWVAVNTEMGRYPTDRATAFARQTQLADLALQALKDGADVILFPEAIAGAYRPSMDMLWAVPAAIARDRGAKILLGVEEWQGKKGYRNALKEPGGELVASSKVPMPVGDWKFGFAPGAEANIFGRDIVEINGTPAAISICYEDFIIWPHTGLLSPFHPRARVLLAPGNQWSSRDLAAEHTQNVSRDALARLAGVPVVSARNR